MSRKWRAVGGQSDTAFDSPGAIEPIKADRVNAEEEAERSKQDPERGLRAWDEDITQTPGFLMVIAS